MAPTTEPRGIADLGVDDMEAENNWMSYDMATRTESSLANPLIAYERGFRECQFPIPTCGFLVRYPVGPIQY